MKTVLLVDDDHSIAEVLTMLLDSEGFAVEVMARADELHEKVVELKPGLIMLDVLLQGQDGRDIARQLKSQEDTKGVPIVLISATRGVERSCAACGADEFLAKPFEIDVLLARVRHYLGE
jgi:DNA-binding response OmpR family regulator